MREDQVKLQIECPCCGAVMHPAVAKTTVWVRERLYVVEDVPAQVCDACGNQVHDEQTTDALRRFTEEAFPSAHAKHQILVPVFSLNDRIKR